MTTLILFLRKLNNEYLVRLTDSDWAEKFLAKDDYFATNHGFSNCPWCGKDLKWGTDEVTCPHCGYKPIKKKQ